MNVLTRIKKIFNNKRKQETDYEFITSLLKRHGTFYTECGAEINGAPGCMLEIRFSGVALPYRMYFDADGGVV